MIEFYGALSNKCKECRAKKIGQKNGSIFLIAAGIVLVIMIVIGSIYNNWYMAIVVVIFCMCSVMAFLKPKSQILKMALPIRIIIDDDKIITTAIGNKSGKKEIALRQVKKVIDNGEWYDIIFKFGDISNSLCCQKDLIVRGTIAEFESVFAHKIICLKDKK